MARQGFFVGALLVLLVPAGACAASNQAPVKLGPELYRYENAQGVVVLDRHGVPPEFIGKGYEVLNQQGRVIRVVPPAPSEAERIRMAEDKARAESDAQLLRLYSTPEDIDRALERKLGEIDAVIALTRANLLSLQTQQATLQSQAAELERSGRKVPQHTVGQIDNLAAEQQQALKDLERYEVSRQEEQKVFMAERERLQQLLERR
jgi:hypothetical protein